MSIGRRTLPEERKFEKESIAKASLYIASNYFSQISNKELADFTNLSLSHFLKLFKECNGTTPQNYLISCRIENAKRLLTETDYSIRHIAESVGFADALYFSKVFKKNVGLTPSEYKKASCGLEK